MPATASLLPVASDSEDAQPEIEIVAHSPLPQPPASIVLTPLLGTTTNSHMHTLTNLYVSQIATLAWHSDPSTRDPVVVGLALKRGGSESGDPTLTEEERRAYFSIMALVKGALDQLQPRRP
jgi:proteasome assembly chaperone 3